MPPALLVLAATVGMDRYKLDGPLADATLRAASQVPESAVERPNAATIGCYDRAVPADPRAVKGQMFAHPCAFVNGHMFFGTFAQTLVVRVGEARAATLASATGGKALETRLRIFEPMAGRAWKEYVQFDAGALADDEVRALAQEALETTARLAPKDKKKPAANKKAP